jgi:predicted esterase
MAGRRHTSWVRLLLLGSVAAVGLGVPGVAAAKDPTIPTNAAAKGWCASEYDALPNDVCHIDGRKAKDGAHRTLVIWLHGVIPTGSSWSHNHQRMLARVAQYNEVEVLFPKGLPADGVYGWPGTLDSQEKNEQALIDQWMAAKTLLEQREKKAFDEVYVFGFSSGAYFASSLAMRGRVAVDGYAVFAGGQPMPARTTPVEKFSPTFVGVCADDKTTANHSRAFAGSLAAAGIPRMVSEQHVGHGLSEVHFAQALSFLHGKAKPAVALRSAADPKPSI